mgnify:CR=1 FL=1
MSHAFYVHEILLRCPRDKEWLQLMESSEDVSLLRWRCPKCGRIYTPDFQIQSDRLILSLWEEDSTEECTQ